METLKIICDVAIICVALTAFATLIIGILSESNVTKACERYGKFLNITIPVMLVCAAVIILTSTLIFHPKFCLMQLFGFILSGCWLILAIFIVYMFKKM